MQVQRIVTQCPHCYNTLKNEYPQFGGDWQVLHHSQFLQELVASGRLELQEGRTGGQATFHDSCYLCRYDGIYAAPRQVLAATPGLHLAELERSRERGFCCGGGGASMWLEHEPGQRIDDLRVDEIEECGPDLAAVACPFCLLMLEEAAAARAGQASPTLQDIAEVVAAAIAQAEQPV